MTQYLSHLSYPKSQGKQGRLFPDILFLYQSTVASLFYPGKHGPKAVALGSV